MTKAALAILGLIAALLAAGTPAATAAEPTCLTPVATDGNEPPCNPALADSPWSASHRAGYAQASSPFPGPAPGDAVATRHLELGVIPIVIDFSSAYADGRRAAWMSTIGAPDLGTIVKVDVATGDTIDTYSLAADEGRGNTGAPSISGAYNLLDRDDHLIVGRAQALEVYADATPGDRMSPIALLKRFTIPARALCRESDSLVGIGMLPDGHVAFATAQGVIGVVPRRIERMDEEHLRTLSINGERCGNPEVADEALENVSNSIAVDEEGDIYTVTDTAQYRHRLRGNLVEEVWRAEYETGTGSGVRLGDGSGATPTLMGTDARDDRFVVITDGQKLMHLVLMWRDEIPAGWKPIEPGKDRRIACEIPVRFGDPNATESLDEQSVLVRGYASILVNNQLRDSENLDGLPPTLRFTAAALAGGDPNRAPYGIERIDWDPRTRTCRSIWANREISIPNGIPSMSSATGLFYGIGQRGGTWGLEAVDFATGASRMWVPTSSASSENSFYAATEVGPDGAIWTGTFGGVTTFRPPAKPAPPMACKDIEAPAVTIRRVRLRGRRVVVEGRRSDTACAARAPVPVVHVARAGGPFVRARPVKGGWRATLRMPKGRRSVTVRARARDREGNEALSRRRTVRRR